MTIVALSIIGKENQPLYLRTFGQKPGGGATDNMQGSGGELRFHFICHTCLLYTSPSPRDRQKSRMPSSA